MTRNACAEAMLVILTNKQSRDPVDSIQKIGGRRVGQSRQPCCSFAAAHLALKKAGRAAIAISRAIHSAPVGKQAEPGDAARVDSAR
jgi:hypothetical protein